MELYIDKENLKNIFRQRNHPLYGDALRAMKQQLDIRFNFTKEDAKKDEVLSLFMPVFNEGVSYEVDHEFLPSVYPSRPIRIDDNLISKSKRSAFLIEDDSKACNECKSCGAFHVYECGEEFLFFERIFLYQRDGQFANSLLIGSPKFQQWNQLAPFFTSLVDVIIVDQFLFCNKKKLGSNLIRFLKTLQGNKKVHLNIIAFTRDSTKDPSYSSIQDIIDHVKNFFFDSKLPDPNLTIITWKEITDKKNTNKKYLDKLAEHDRTVYTNYVRIKSGGSLNIFDFEGEQQARVREFDLVSLARRQYKELGDALINDLQNIITTYKKECPENIIGALKSNFLKF